MSRVMKTILWDKVKWQEAFPIGRGKFLCPYCGEEVAAKKPWGICLTREEHPYNAHRNTISLHG